MNNSKSASLTLIAVHFGETVHVINKLYVDDDIWVLKGASSKW